MAGQTGGKPARNGPPLLDGSTVFFVLLALGAGLAVLLLRGADAFNTALADGLGLLLLIMPIVVAAVLVGAYVQAMVPREAMERWLGGSSGMRGLLLATAAGSLTPGGPFAAFPLVLALYRSGAAVPVCVTYLTSWSVLGINRALVWELPLLGPEFTLTRLLVSLPLPLIAGLLTRGLLHRFSRTVT
ncbi:permease [Methylonatrum kenyense]|uniref:permease n=1 Tax=Methylonatrum kenyense TaxID=455253 RepID=UPI0020BD7F31|nr:permease [Methylonatrum kenyense]MCK8516072.1 permease [Methylonatrum kenyense]